MARLFEKLGFAAERAAADQGAVQEDVRVTQEELVALFGLNQRPGCIISEACGK